MTPRHPIRSIQTHTGPVQPDPDGHGGASQDAATAQDGPVADEPVWADRDVAAEEAQARMAVTRGDKWVSAGATLLALAWTALFIAGAGPRMSANPDAAELAALIQGWALPVILIAVLWLLFMRSSTREARRFGNLTNSLERQTVVLEERLLGINRELSLAREFLSAETRELDYLGRAAVERIGEHAGTLQALIQQNGAQVDGIASVSNAALDNMNRLRQELPVIAASARDMSNLIGNVGRSASEQIALLKAGFEDMTQAGHANESQIETLRNEAAETVAFVRESIAELAGQAHERLAELRHRTEDYRRTMLAQEEEALASVKSRATRFGSELSVFHARLAEEEDAHLARVEQRLAATREQIGGVHEEIAARTQEADHAGQRRLDGLRDYLIQLLSEIEQLERQADATSGQRLGVLRDSVDQVDSAISQRLIRTDKELARQREAWEQAEQAALAQQSERHDMLDQQLSAYREQQVAQTLMLAEHSEEIAQRVAAATEQMGEIVAAVEDAHARIEAAAAGLTTRLGDGRELIDESDMALNSVLQSGERMQVLLQNSLIPGSGELRGTLTSAVADLEHAERSGTTIATTLQGVTGATAEITASLAEAAELSRSAGDAVAALGGSVAASQQEHAAAFEQLRSELAALEERAEATAEHLRHSLQRAGVAIRDELAAALQDHGGDEGVVASLAQQVGTRSAEALSGALEESGLKIADEMAQRMQTAAETGREAVMHLRDQLARVHELTSNLEARIARAREQSEENVDNDFSRRVALITERLNSTAIDLDNLLSVEVSETAWASYLKGDRGIFTRKVLKLLNRRDAKEIADLYNADSEFRDHVNRYVHDFEAMLRSLLSTRNGNALGVLILSSDMGKLYVALAQSIERLRN